MIQGGWAEYLCSEVHHLAASRPGQSTFYVFSLFVEDDLSCSACLCEPWTCLTWLTSVTFAGHAHNARRRPSTFSTAAFSWA